ncbi:hypothetical protein M9H77_25844 [Catharanthus roseus]|uniref:Uncharacterized protein n=1 Tax=Catharanthus roseus TaxID=4058 RepID=A0ACC0A8Y9_CATRO|nr:hypothetical protein M9H77_25844 [Catharanthus roseus]
MDSEMRSLTDLLHKISTGPISKVREMLRLAKGVLSLVLPKDSGVTLTSLFEGDHHEFLGEGAEGAPMDEVVYLLFNWKNVVGGRNCGYRVVTDFLFGDEHQWPEAGLAPLEHWLETPDSLYVIANAFNLCVVLIAQLGSTTTLPLYSYSDRPGATDA